jgi:hypothetical protein
LKFNACMQQYKDLVKEGTKDSILASKYLDTNVIGWKPLNIFWGECKGGVLSGEEEWCQRRY